MPSPEISSFSIMPRILAHFGDELIRNEIIALTELAKNSYDAGATKCVVSFHFDESSNDLTPTKIVIEDNGVGMDRNDIINKWLVIGTDNKKIQLNSYSEEDTPNRIPLGEKGVGRFGVHKLGTKVSLTTKKEGNKALRLSIDWSKLSDSKTIQDFPVSVIPYSGKFREHGLTIEITGINEKKHDWTKAKLRNIFRALTALNINFSKKSDCRFISENFNQNITQKSLKSIERLLTFSEKKQSDKFTIKVKSIGRPDIFDGLMSFNEIKKSALYECDILLEGNKISAFEYNFNPWPSLQEKFPPQRIELSDLGKEAVRLKQKIGKNIVPINLDSDIKIGPIYVKIYAFELTPAIVRNLDGRDIVRAYLKENSGVRVYRDGVRVYDYGEPENDWLDLKSGSGVGEKLRSEHVIAYVFIDRRKSTDLIEKTNREGFIENQAYSIFLNALDWAIKHVFLQRRNSTKQILSEYYSTTSEPIISLLDETLEYIDKNIDDPGHKKTLTKTIKKAAREYKEIVETLYHSAALGLSSASVIHEAEKIVRLINKSFDQEEEQQTTRALIRRLSETIDRFSFLIQNTEIKKMSPASILDTPLKYLRMRLKIHKTQIERIDTIDKDIQCLASANKATNIFLNLIDNSLYWLEKSSRNNKKIKIFSTSSYLHGSITFIFSDNGPGFSDNPTYLAKPFVSTKPFNMGKGLGLYISSELLSSMEGQLTFPERDQVVEVLGEEACLSSAIIALHFKIARD